MVSYKYSIIFSKLVYICFFTFAVKSEPDDASEELSARENNVRDATEDKKVSSSLHYSSLTWNNWRSSMRKLPECSEKNLKSHLVISLSMFKNISIRFD